MLTGRGLNAKVRDAHGAPPERVGEKQNPEVPKVWGLGGAFPGAFRNLIQSMKKTVVVERDTVMHSTECPQCTAGKGEPCKGRRSPRIRLHLSRWRLWIERTGVTPTWYEEWTTHY